jgi:lycopene beta-cyclase
MESGTRDPAAPARHAAPARQAGPGPDARPESRPGATAHAGAHPDRAPAAHPAEGSPRAADWTAADRTGDPGDTPGDGPHPTASATRSTGAAHTGTGTDAGSGLLSADAGSADAVIVGAGAAGLSLAHRLAADPAGPGVSVLLLDAPPGPLRPPPRTWCFWAEPGTGPYDAVVTAAWRHLRVRGPAGGEAVGDVAPARYLMLRSPDVEALVARELAAPGVRLRRVAAAVGTVRDAPGGTGAEAFGTGPDGRPFTAHGRWLYDSRPPRLVRGARTLLLQHFHGWFVRTERPVFDPEVADLMDFRVPQPRHGLAFGYVLPTGRREALVEYTEFSRAVLTPAAYRAALERWTRDVLRLGPLRVTGTETGVIPMTDGRFPPVADRSVFRIGTAGGATRPSTGYTFAAAVRQAAGVAEAWRAGRRPVPPSPYPARARVMDAVLLRALDGGTDGAALFWELVRRVPMPRLLRFLDGRGTLAEDLAVGLRAPVRPMVRAAVSLPWVPRRDLPLAGAPPGVLAGPPPGEAASVRPG